MSRASIITAIDAELAELEEHAMRLRTARALVLGEAVTIGKLESPWPPADVEVTNGAPSPSAMTPTITSVASVVSKVTPGAKFVPFVFDDEDEQEDEEDDAAGREEDDEEDEKPPSRQRQPAPVRAARPPRPPAQTGLEEPAGDLSQSAMIDLIMKDGGEHTVPDIVVRARDRKVTVQPGSVAAHLSKRVSAGVFERVAPGRYRARGAA